MNKKYISFKMLANITSIIFSSNIHLNYPTFPNYIISRAKSLKGDHAKLQELRETKLFSSHTSALMGLTENKDASSSQDGDVHTGLKPHVKEVTLVAGRWSWM